MRLRFFQGALIVGALAFHGCVAGYNSVLFATRSNVGVDMDTQPPTMEVAISRTEGVIMPTFEDGQVLPVLSSFAASTRGPQSFFFGVDSTFSTGQAAHIMSYLWDDFDNARTVDVPETRVTLTREPRLRLGMMKCLKSGQVRPVVFGTDTLLGVKLAWSGQTAQYPSGAKIGFNRKEMAWAPVALSPGGPGDDKPIVARIPSLLATLDHYVRASGVNSELTYVQYFATGEAANNLAKRRDVREAVAKRTDPEAAAGFLRRVARTQSSRRLQELLDSYEREGRKADFEKEMKAFLDDEELSVSVEQFIHDIMLEEQRVKFLRPRTTVSPRGKPSPAAQIIIDALTHKGASPEDYTAYKALRDGILEWMKKNSITGTMTAFLNDPTREDKHGELLKHLKKLNLIGEED